MAIKHFATLIKNGTIIAEKVSFRKALLLAGLSEIKGADRARASFYKGTPFYFCGLNSVVAIIPSKELSGKRIGINSDTLSRRVFDRFLSNIRKGRLFSLRKDYCNDAARQYYLAYACILSGDWAQARGRLLQALDACAAEFDGLDYNNTHTEYWRCANNIGAINSLLIDLEGYTLAA